MVMTLAVSVAADDTASVDPRAAAALVVGCCGPSSVATPPVEVRIVTRLWTAIVVAAAAASYSCDQQPPEKLASSLLSARCALRRPQRCSEGSAVGKLS